MAMAQRYQTSDKRNGSRFAPAAAFIGLANRCYLVRLTVPRMIEEWPGNEQKKL